MHGRPEKDHPVDDGHDGGDPVDDARLEADATVGGSAPQAPDAVGPDPVGPDAVGPDAVATADGSSGGGVAGTGGQRGRLAGLLVAYTALRLGLIAVLAAVLQLFMPLIVALAFAVVIQLPMSLLLFGGPRRRVTAELAAASAHREAERSRLRAALRGETESP